MIPTTALKICNRKKICLHAAQKKFNSITSQNKKMQKIKNQTRAHKKRHNLEDLPYHYFYSEQSIKTFQ
jgi:hypothetical protein